MKYVAYALSFIKLPAVTLARLIIFVYCKSLLHTCIVCTDTGESSEGGLKILRVNFR